MTLYDRYSKLVFAVANHVVADAGVAEDISQEVFLQLWQKVHSFDPARGSLGAWLTVVTRHRAIDVTRKRKADVNIEDVVIPIDSKQLSEFSKKEITGKVCRALDGLPEAQQEVFKMAYFQGMTQEEISAKTGEPLGTVKSRARLALNWMRKKFLTGNHDLK